MPGLNLRGRRWSGRWGLRRGDFPPSRRKEISRMGHGSFVWSLQCSLLWQVVKVACAAGVLAGRRWRRHPRRIAEVEELRHVHLRRVARGERRSEEHTSEL